MGLPPYEAGPEQETIIALRSFIAEAKSLWEMGQLSPWSMAASQSSFVIAMSWSAPSLLIVYVLLPGCLKSPKTSMAAARAEMSDLLDLVIPLEASTATGLPGSPAGVGVGILVGLVSVCCPSTRWSLPTMWVCCEGSGGFGIML